VAIHLTLALTFFNFVGANAARVVLTLFALELGAPASSVGFIGGLMYLFPLLLSWPIGAMADRLGSRGLLTFASFCGAVSLVLPYFVHSLPAFYIAAALNGLALSFFHVTLQNLIGILSKPEDRPRNFSNFSLTGSLTNFTGPLLAGFSIDHVGHAGACLMIAAPSAVAILLLLARGRLLPPPSTAAAAPGPSALKSLGDSEVRRMLATSGMVQLGTDLFQFYIPIYGHSIGLSASAIGAILATLAAASFVVRLFLARLVKQVPSHKLLSRVFWVGATGFALVPFFESPVALAAVAFLFGLGMGIGIPLTVMMMFARTTEGRSGQTLGLRLTANNFVRVTGPIVFGALASAFGLPPVFWVNAVMMLGGSLIARSGKAGDPGHAAR
jgi:MFS family permease